MNACRLQQKTSTRASRNRRKLFKIVRPHAPWKIHDEDRSFSGFRGAFRWIMSQSRIDRPNPKCDLDFFVGGCRTWLRDRGSMAGALM
jgi:hypothetical protein